MKSDQLFWNVVLRHRNAIVDECRRVCPERRDLLGDLVGEVMLELHKRRRNVIASRRRQAYLRTIASRVARRALRKEIRYQKSVVSCQ